MSETYFITIFIPTYNRVKYLPRLFDSLEQQTVRNFKVLIIDDGSTDKTDEYVKSITQQASYPITYHKKVNGRKASAYNYAIPLVDTPLTFELDSDDYVVPNALEVIEREWKNYEQQNNKMIAMRFLAFYHGTDRVIGDKFPETLKYASQYQLRYNHKIKGDKTLVFLTENLKKCRFPDIPTENVKMSILYNRVCKEGGLVGCSNQVLMAKEYLEVGITSEIKKETVHQLFRYPLSNAIYFNELNYFKLSVNDYLRHNAQYVKFELHNGKSFIEIYKNNLGKNIFVFPLVYLLGYFKFYKKKVL